MIRNIIFDMVGVMKDLIEADTFKIEGFLVREKKLEKWA